MKEPKIDLEERELSSDEEEYLKHRSYADELHGKEEHTGLVFVLLLVFILIAAYCVRFFI